MHKEKYPDQLNEMLDLQTDEERKQVAKAWKNFQQMHAETKPQHKKDDGKKKKAKLAKQSRKKNRK